jgi:hypothetical protein
VKEIALKLLLVAFAVGLCTWVLFSNNGLSPDARRVQSTTHDRVTNSNTSVDSSNTSITIVP